MKRWKRGSLPVGFQFIYPQPRTHAWNTTGEKLWARSSTGQTADVTDRDIVSELGRLGYRLLENKLANANQLGAIWRRDVIDLADEVGTINRATEPKGFPVEATDTTWEWATLSLHVGASIEALSALTDFPNLKDLREHARGRLEQFWRDYADNHPIRQALPRSLPVNPWEPYVRAFMLAGQAPRVKSEYRANVAFELRMRLDHELRLDAPISLIPTLFVARPTLLAMHQLVELWDDEARTIARCKHCKRPFPVRYEGPTARQQHCSERCRKAASEERRKTRSSASPRRSAGHSR